ncbi:trifunctional purine biosynthetic protein adenosine-3-like isoform X1 [Branchiostoma floridae x Branchiostoma belcheri]
MGDKVLVLGSGGREHVLAWKIAQSQHVGQVLVAPGNAGTTGGKISNTDVPKAFADLAQWCLDNKIDMVVVGPEAPLADGVADTLAAKGVPCFGPTAKAAQIEASKAFSKDFMDRHNIPTARWQQFTDAKSACDFINSADFPALVVKASGLAAGKGVIVAGSKADACSAVKDILEDHQFGAAGDVVVVEELLVGQECSCLAFSDGKTIACMPPAQDHKRLLENDEGPNTGGMGAYCPTPQVDEATLKKIQTDILQKTIDGMNKDGTPYIGVLYAGIMLTKDGPKVLEFNCRFGDPEAQVLLPLLKSDLYATIMECVNGDLQSAMPQFHTDRAAVAIVMASGGYPGSYKKGMEITGIDKWENSKDKIVFHAGTALKDGKVVTSGGRVLAVTAIASSLSLALAEAKKGAEVVTFPEAVYRRDIGKRAIDYLENKRPGLSYAQCGVDIDAGNQLVQAIKPLAASTARQGCTAELGGFGGMFDVKAAGYTDPILVSGTDGVGTKLKIAQAYGKHDTVGEDLVAMCVNDILAHGAEALYFLDYFACGKLDVGVARDVVKGVAQGCKLAGCALLGGETAEMPGMYAAGDYDLAGFAVGAVERGTQMPRVDAIRPGDVIVGVASSGVHSNGFSLVRKVIEAAGLTFQSAAPFSSHLSVGEALLTPTKIYAQTLLPVIRSGNVQAFAHITGGGLVENIPRVLPDNISVKLDATRWTIPSVFGWVSGQGGVTEAEMAKTFNCGVGAVLVVERGKEETVLEDVRKVGETAWVIGTCVESTQVQDRVTIDNLSAALRAVQPTLKRTTQDRTTNKKMKLVNGQAHRTKVGVLISGTGTNLQALIDHSTDPKNKSAAEIVLVISNIPGVKGLERAEKAGIPTKVISHKGYKKREEFDRKVHEALVEAGVEMICLAGFMRILSGWFVQQWTGNLLNIHPSLLPSFKGMNAHKLALEAGVRVSGCTVHFVVEEVDAGAIVAQEAVPVKTGDTVESLQERVKTAEHKCYPRAMELVARRLVGIDSQGKLVRSDTD